MMKFCSISNHLILLVLCLVVKSACAQNATENTDENMADDSTVVTVAEQNDDNSNDFEHVMAVSDIATQLREQYGIKGSVSLSKTLWKVLTSFSNQQQAQAVWQAAINQLAEDNADSMPHVSVVNSQYNAGRVLTEFTHGMTINKWNVNRQVLKLNKQNLADFLTVADDVSIYLKLSEIWQILLDDITKQPEIQWRDVFLDSLNIFAEHHGESEQSSQNQEPQNQEQEKTPEVVAVHSSMDILQSLKTWHTAENKNSVLSEAALMIESQPAEDQYLYEAMIRFILDKLHGHYLSTAQSWFALAEQLYFHRDGISPEMSDMVMSFIEENDAWFLSKEQQLLAINEKLPEWVESSFHHLKAYYNGQATIAEANLMTVYEIVDVGFKKYMQNPFRRKIQKDLEICLNISEEFAPYPQQPIDAKQFRGCINDMVVAATKEASGRELSGSLTKIDSQQALDRALQLPAWQIINILYANSAESNCLKDEDQLVNPLEWTLAAESLLWFADRWPAYMRSYPQDNEIKKMIATGQSLLDNYGCLVETEQNVLDAQYTKIIQSWENVKVQIRQLISEFNAENLTQGSDINLLENVEQQSNYRVENVSIMECDAQNSCGVHIELESSRALFGLFPNHLLVADQLKLGSLKLCYDNVGWEQRRAAPTHLNNDSVANYFGHFSFSLKGYYDEELVFERKLTDAQEYLYLFAENSEEVSNIYCPLPIVGKNIATELKEGTYGLVPNRLTFLTASRADENEILQSNWSKGQEWRDKILSDEGQKIHLDELSDLSSDIHQAYQTKAAELQALIYQTILATKSSPTDIQKQLVEGFNDMQRSKDLFAALNYFLRMDELMLNDDLHGILFGEDKIPDLDAIQQFYQNQTNINVLISSIDENMNLNKEKWNKSKDWLSHSHIGMILYRLKSINP